MPTAAAASTAAPAPTTTTSASARGMLSAVLVSGRGRAATRAPTATAAASTPTTTAAQRTERGASRARASRTRRGRLAGGPEEPLGAPAGRLRRGSASGSVTTREITREPVRPPPSSPETGRSLVSLAAMRALVVVNPAATSTTAKMRDVLVGALGSELKVDVVETDAPRARPRARRPGGRRGHRPRGRRRRRRHRERGRQRPARAAAPAPQLPMLAVVPGGSTNVFSRALGRSRDPVEATAEILDSLRAGRTRLVSLGTASASGTDDADDGGWTAPALVRLRRRPRLRRRGHRAGGGPARRGTTVHRRPVRPGGHHAPSCWAASAGGRR